MRSLALVAGEHVEQDALFDAASRYNRDDCLRGFRLLREAVERGGGACHTHDVFLSRGEVPDVVLHLDVPRDPAHPSLLAWRGRTERWVFLLESEVIAPWNWQRERWYPFSRVFTWHDGLADADRFVKLDHHVPYDRTARALQDRTGHIAVVSGNKTVRHPLELYSTRLEAVRWADRHRPGSLDLYGTGWERRVLPGRVGGVLSARTPLGRLLARPPAAYRGLADRKGDVLSRYRFSLCLENARDIPGYITEKMIDVMLAGAVPVYRGADNVTDHVPAECFIDVRDFDGWQALWDHLAQADDAELEQRRTAATRFLDSPTGRRWSAEHFARTVSELLA